jgi:protein TonB
MTGGRNPGVCKLYLLPPGESGSNREFRNRSGSARTAASEFSVAARVRTGAESDASVPPRADLSNVIPFAPVRRAESKTASFDVALTASERSAPKYPADHPWRLAAVLSGSLAVHVALLAVFGQPPPPMASVGVQSISVEIVLGTDMPAGPAKTDGENAIESAASPQQLTPADPATEVAEAATVQPLDVPIAERATAPVVVAETVRPAGRTAIAPDVRQEVVLEAPPVDVASSPAPGPQTRPASNTPAVEAVRSDETRPAIAMIETPQPELPTSRPPETQPEASAILPTSPAPAITPQEQAALPDRPLPEPKPAVKPAPPVAKQQAQPEPPRVDQRAAERRRIAARQAEKPAQRRSSVASPNSRAASSIGRGRSDLSTNYRGIVAAQLARQKRYPPDARSAGQEGVATVTFRIGGSGQVSGVRLARSSGSASLDREVQAMVQRAAPFPPPPGGQSMTFAAPISFRLR